MSPILPIHTPFQAVSPSVVVEAESMCFNHMKLSGQPRQPCCARQQDSFSSLRTILIPFMLSFFIEKVVAQAPVNDVISWPPGLLLLASVLYAALGNTPAHLWEIEPTIGVCLFAGLPLISIPTMKRVNWVADACHFVSGIRSAFGKYNFWVRTNDISSHTRKEALEKAVRIGCVRYEEGPLDTKIWRRTSEGLVSWVDTQPLTTLPVTKSDPPVTSITARDFLLFAAIDYHAFREVEVKVTWGDVVLFSTKDMPASSVIDVESVGAAIPVVAAQMARRPYSQSPVLVGKARQAQQRSGEFVVDLDAVDMDAKICMIDFHSYAPESAKVAASLNELARAYYLVVQHIKSTCPAVISPSSLARINVGQTLWIAILGGALLDKGRLTIQNLPGRWGSKDVTPDEAYLTRIEAVVEILQPHANQKAFDDLVFSGGLSRRTAWPFFIAGIVGQVIVCYFLSVGTTAGVWTSVALSNSLYAGRLTDWHSLWYGRSEHSEEPGFKMYVPGSKDLMCIATLDRTTPRQGLLRPGFVLNTLGLIAAIVGAVFQRQTREVLGFGDFVSAASWVSYTTIALCLGSSLLISVTILLQQIQEKTWQDDSEIPTRWMVYSTVFASAIVSALAIVFQLYGLQRFWPILDALTWVSGLPMGMLENGRMISVDDNVLHLALLNRWIMGAVASAVGSTTRAG